MKNIISYRTEILCKTKLNSVNLFKAINEYALSTLNYYIGILKIEPEEFKKIDDMIRNILNQFSIFIKPSNKQRLYLPRSKLGRGLGSAEYKNEIMNLNLHNYLNRNGRSDRQDAIFKSESQNNSFLAGITKFLSIKYKSESVISEVKCLKSKQMEQLFELIQSKKEHCKFFRGMENEFVDLKRSATWFRNGNNKPQDEAAYCALQDRNIFMIK